jgi:hypothetical protein
MSLAEGDLMMGGNNEKYSFGFLETSYIYSPEGHGIAISSQQDATIEKT